MESEKVWKQKNEGKERNNIKGRIFSFCKQYATTCNSARYRPYARFS